MTPPTPVTDELGRYRTVLAELSALREVTFEPPEELLDRLLAEIPEHQRWARLRRVAEDERVQHAALSVGGAFVGATAIGLLWWRRNHRALTRRGIDHTAGLARPS
jgi:hypothetical protein